MRLLYDMIPWKSSLIFFHSCEKTAREKGSQTIQFFGGPRVANLL